MAKPTTTKTTAPEMEQFDNEASRGQVAVFQPPRLPYHDRVQEAFGVDKGQWKVLVEAIYPAAKSVDAIVMALTYCKSRNLDPFKRPVHIVPMWDSARGAMVETVWPGISELRTTASRTGQYAGCDEAQFGANVTMEFKGRVKERGEFRDSVVTVEFPEWCRITVHRIVAGHLVKFVGPKVSWLESYATIGNTDLPNKMWQERPEGQLEKCAEAAALRRAFPEEIGNELAAEEMIGRHVQDLELHAETTAASPAGEATSNRDAAPPRAAPKAQEPPKDGEVRDGTPPRRAPAAEPPKEQPKEKADPISTGRQPANDQIKTSTVQPFAISGKGEDADSWSAKYIDNIKTSPDVATLYKWVDLNTKALERLTKVKPSAYNKVKTETERLQEGFRDAARKATEKAQKPAPQPEPSMEDEATEMDDDGSDTDSVDYGAPASDGPEDVLAWVEKTLAAVTEPEDLENVWNDIVAPRTEDLFPPDQDEARGIYRKHEKRLEP
ncbi:MAG TPA: phage recombination protein Bet [Pseudorhodoplanes sp.]|nr:phage recombination protein Bet [Pseudorhodoplanes sp.]